MLGNIANSLGFGSGIDVSKLVRDLAAASRQPKIAAINERAQTVQARISAVAEVRSVLENFSQTLSAVASEGTMRPLPVVSDEAAISAETIGSGPEDASSTSIVVSQLAQAQSLYSGLFASSGDAVGEGSLTLTIGGQTTAIVIGSADATLAGVANAINAANAGVSARIVTDGGGARLVLKGQSGAANAFTLAADAGSAPGLAALAYPGAVGLTLAAAASDAQFTVDGVPFSRAGNTVSDVLPGVSFTLKEADPAKTVTLGIARQAGAVTTTMRDFVNVFNELRQEIREARDSTNADPALRALDRRLSSFVSQTVTGHPTINSLDDVGISTNRDGTITLDEQKLARAFAAEPDAVEALFDPPGQTGAGGAPLGLAANLSALADSVLGTNGGIEALGRRLSREAEEISKTRERIEAREAAYEAQLEKRFGGLEARLSALQATQAYLDQQIKVWTRDA